MRLKRPGPVTLLAVALLLLPSLAHGVRLITEQLNVRGPLQVRAAPAASATRSLVQLGTRAITGGSAAGTYLGANPAAFTGNWLDFQINGTSKAKLTGAGVLTTAGGMTATTGNITATAGDLVATAGNLSVAAGTSTLVGDVTFGSTLLSDVQGAVTKSDNYTLAAADSGLVVKCATDGVVFTLPATVAGMTFTILNTGADGTVGISLSPDAADKIQGGGLAAADNEDLINTKATAKKGDMIRVVGDGADGWFVQEIRGVWSEQTP
jgi:hypothetical protein